VNTNKSFDPQHINQLFVQALSKICKRMKSMADSRELS